MSRSKPFGCSTVCISGFAGTVETIQTQLEQQEAQTEKDILACLMICCVVKVRQAAVISVLAERGWELLTTYNSNSYHDYHDMEIWGKKYNRNPKKEN